MTREDYLENLVADIETYWFDNNEKKYYEGLDPDDIYEELNDDLFVSDSVTGYASGSYTFNTWKARENVIDALDVLGEACEAFDCVDELGRKFVNGEW